MLTALQLLPALQDRYPKANVDVIRGSEDRLCRFPHLWMVRPLLGLYLAPVLTGADCLEFVGVDREERLPSPHYPQLRCVNTFTFHFRVVSNDPEEPIEDISFGLSFLREWVFRLEYLQNPGISWGRTGHDKTDECLSIAIDWFARHGWRFISGYHPYFAAGTR